MSIMVLSRSENTHADVIETNCKLHTSVERINFNFDTQELGCFPRVAIGKGFERVPSAVFVHHPRISYKQDWFKDENERKLFLASWDSLKEWMESAFSGARWINRPSATLRNKNILGQLQLATTIGFKTPDTIFTNSKEELLSFACNDLVVIKQGNLGVHLENKCILTSQINAGTIDSNILNGSPCLFQKYIPKRYELRVHVIGDQVLSCKIESQVGKKTLIDWRNYDLPNTPHKAIELESLIARKCVDLVRKLGLEFGIIDLIVNPEGEYVFLECNSQGHWLWIEELTSLPITKTLCENLLKGPP